jgi:hypothetical protein
VSLSVFRDDARLKHIRFKPGSQMSRFAPGCFLHCDLRSTRLPPLLEAIPDHCFAGCEHLESVVFEAGSTLTRIESKAFAGCTSLTSIVIPATVRQLGARIFKKCAHLASLVFEAGFRLSTTGPGVFQSTPSVHHWSPRPTSLQHLCLPPSIEVLDVGCFAGTELVDIVFDAVTYP